MTTLAEKFELHVPSSIENLALIREFTGRVARKSGLAKADVKRLELAVDEACTNVIEHAYGSDCTKEVLIQASFDDEQLVIVVSDTGLDFDPTTVPPKEVSELIESRATGGLGLRLIKAIMDEVSYDFEPGEKNELRMVKNLK
jgi:serine/threonine-protein kinase RsbW